jgi:tetratricopeptide (TPR) repeat protein
MTERVYVFLVWVALGLATLIAFESVCSCKFVSYDDYQYVTGNSLVRMGLTRQSVTEAFTTIHASGNWHPLTLLSHMADCELFGLNPFWHHFVNLLFHIVNTLLLFEILRRITGAVWQSAFVAALFALHPVHVESVAWVAERKDVLSAFFWMLTIAVYVWYCRRPAIGKYVLVILFLCLGLMAKPMLVTLPFVLLLLDYWPLRRFGWAAQNEPLLQSGLNCSDLKKVSPVGLILEKAPLFVVSAFFILIACIVQRGVGAMAPAATFPLKFRLANALVSYVGYIVKMIYPRRLAVLYPLRLEGLPAWQPIVAFVILAVVSAIVIYAGRRRRYLIVGWLWFLATLVPVIGLVQVGIHAMADRYTYLPSIGFFIIITWGTADILGKWRYKETVLKVSAVAVLVILVMCTRAQVGYWQNDFTLYKRAVEVTEDNYIMHNNFGDVLLKKDRPEEAVRHFKEALQINPNHLEARLNIGVVLSKLGKFDEAVECFKEVLRFRRDWPVAYNNLGRAYALLGEYDLAIQNYKEALRLKPNYPAATKNLQAALDEQGKDK